MRKVLILLAALALGGPVFAADMATKMPVEAPPPAPAFSWTGFYGGLSLGARLADNVWTTTHLGPIAMAAGISPGLDAVQPFDSTAARFGGYAGYNWQVTSTWIFGVEVDTGWANNRKTKVAIPGTTHLLVLGVPTSAVTGGDTSSVSESWDGSIRARLGFLITPTTLLYGTGGPAWQTVEGGAICVVNATFSSVCTFPLVVTTHSESFTTTKAGWTVGGGVEQMIWNNWLLRAEYRYADFGSLNHEFFSSDIGLGQDDQIFTHMKVVTQTATVGVAYKF
jgi:outer membrane immunogenic protein